MKRVVVILLLASQPLLVAAQEPGPAPAARLAALLREAERNSPALRAAAARLEAARRVPSQAGALPDPEASLGYTNEGTSRFTLGDAEDTRLTLGFRQEVPYPGKRRRASEAAGFEVERVARDLERLRLEIAASVKSAYADLYRIDRTAAILRETHALLRSFADTTRLRYEAGQGIQESVLKAETEVLRLEAEQARVAQERRTAEVRLAAVLGRTDDVSIEAVEILHPADLPPDLDALVDSAVAGAPEIGALEAEIRRNEASVALARLNLKPDFVWTAAYDYRGEIDPMITGMVGLRLPLYRERKQAQALQQAEADLLAARHDLAERQVEIRAEVRELVARARRAERLAALIGRGVIPQALGTLESARASYGVGRLAFLDLLSDLTTVLNGRIDLAGQEADRFQALASLEPLVGGALIRVPGAAEEGDMSDDPGR